MIVMLTELKGVISTIFDSLLDIIQYEKERVEWKEVNTPFRPYCLIDPFRIIVLSCSGFEILGQLETANPVRRIFHAWQAQAAL